MNNLHNIIHKTLENNDVNVLVVLITSFVVSLFSIPIIINIARVKNFLDKPNGRTSHFVNTPTLGGVALYAALLLSLLLFGTNHKDYGLPYIIASVTIIFFIGIKDDIYFITFKKKLIGQLTVVSILIFLGDIRFSSFYGFLGIYELPYVVSILVSTFIFIVIINCINLVDGIDGLASGLSILFSGIFIYAFYTTNTLGHLLIATSLLGSLIPFFIYNVFSKKNKLFMGDTGALILGVIFTILIVEFNKLSNTDSFILTAAPAMSIAILFVPLYDTLQVFVIRVFKNRSPFSPDKNHLHHRLLNLGFNHLQTTSLLVILNAFIIVIGYFLQPIGILALSLVLLLIGLAFSTSLWIVSSRKELKAA